jgi:outer membrane PBP1 activator LpoA protein
VPDAGLGVYEDRLRVPHVVIPRPDDADRVASAFEIFCNRRRYAVL